MCLVLCSMSIVLRLVSFGAMSFGLLLKFVKKCGLMKLVVMCTLVLI